MNRDSVADSMASDRKDKLHLYSDHVMEFHLTGIFTIIIEKGRTSCKCVRSYCTGASSFLYE